MYYDENKLMTTNILGVNVNVINMQCTLEFIEKNLSRIKGKYICVSNVHTTVMSYENDDYCNIQNEGIMALPDGKPLSVVSKLKGFKNADRVTGPDLMEEIFNISYENGYKHYFYGSTEETLEELRKKLLKKYPNLSIVGMYSPPFRSVSIEEDNEIIKNINQCNPDFIWVGLGAPKQEIWMNEHKDKVNGLMIGVGAGFDYHAEKLKRAPIWMQKSSLEWLYRLMQDPARLLTRYFNTNIKFTMYLFMNLVKKVY
ncbi:WecB/TagA/CpsF family glycosyltransferase [Gottfriedia acidiceleris]|uniref:WecB/TagA/CpsF family glycosyltransferase n=1 Tax=Gottfriedia acidiceleris TaxID=371036 RepID=UPI000B453A47|nr:WecB/TagA/CpsF family glycosyltransferase [Gottfriedia acidiceleris]